MEDIEGKSLRTFPLTPKSEEFPMEEFDAVPDWNAAAWEQIKARDAKALKKQSLIDHLAQQPTQALESVLKVCIHEQQDAELQELVRAELERRSATTDPVVAQ